MQDKFVSYLRVSTDMQGRSGLGLEAQRQAVACFLRDGQRTVLSELVEVESGSRNDRPELQKALALCRLHHATLVIAKLDRLSRDAHFLLGLQKAGARFVAADMPEANEMVVGIMAVIAQAERQMISKRTREALAAKRAYYVALSDAELAALKAAGKATQLGNPRISANRISVGCWAVPGSRKLRTAGPLISPPSFPISERPVLRPCGPWRRP